MLLVEFSIGVPHGSFVEAASSIEVDSSCYYIPFGRLGFLCGEVSSIARGALRSGGVLVGCHCRRRLVENWRLLST